MSGLRMGVLWLVFLASAPLAAASGTIVPVPVVEGLSCGKSTLPDGGEGIEVAEATGEALGEQRTLITLINFTDDPSTPYTPSQVGFAVLDTGNPASTANYIDEVSYGRAWLTGDALGWFSMPWADGGSCLLSITGQTQPIVDALDPLIDFSLYDRWLIFIPPTAACGFSGFSSLGKMTFTTDEGAVQMSQVIMNGFGSVTNLLAAHELGHSMAGLQHSLDYECGADVIRDSCTASGLGSLTDPYDIMGETLGGGHYTAPNKDALGWLGPDVVEVPPPGGQYSLLPFETTAPGLKVLRIPVTYSTEDTARTVHYYVSYRKPLGRDAGFPELAADGAMLHVDSRAWVGDAVRRTWLLDASPHVDASATAQAADSADSRLPVGGTYTDAEKGITIAVVGVNDGRLDVSVTISGYCGNAVLDPGIGEQCDGMDLGAASCTSLGRLDGRLACAADCTWATDGCGLPRCAEGHGFDPATSRCRATFLADLADCGLWRSRASFTDVREDVWAKGIFEDIWISFLLTQRLDGFTWIYRSALPFDTSSIPDGAQILSGELLLKVVMAGGIANTHPDSADQLVLVHPTLAGPPQAWVGDYPNFGALDNPEEGGPRIDVGDEIAIGMIKSWPLNATGLGWIDPTGWSTFGVRTGFDVDNVWFPGVAMDLHVQVRSSHSYTFGPRLVVEYAAAPNPPTGAAGAVSNLTVAPATGGMITLTWDASCNAADSDYAIYEGTVGDSTSHVLRYCSTGGATTMSLVPAAENTYYLVVPRSADREGSYGADSAGVERPAAAAACVPRQVGTCGGGS